MPTDKLNRLWLLVTSILLAIIILGGIVIWLRYSPSQPIEITLPPTPELRGKLHIDGAVTVPGTYSFTAQDSIESLLQAAGGVTSSANLSGVRLYIPEAGQERGSQKIDINRAEVWLLKALPGIGETLAQRIVDYREKNGPFLNTYDLTKVAGIGASTYEQIKNLITVND